MTDFTYEDNRFLININFKNNTPEENNKFISFFGGIRAPILDYYNAFKTTPYLYNKIGKFSNYFTKCNNKNIDLYTTINLPVNNKLIGENIIQMSDQRIKFNEKLFPKHIAPLDIMFEQPVKSDIKFIIISEDEYNCRKVNKDIKKIEDVYKYIYFYIAEGIVYKAKETENILYFRKKKVEYKDFELLFPALNDILFNKN